MIVEITGKIKIDYRSREWCKMPYPRHPKGCPNYDTLSRCPPRAPLIEEFIDLSKRYWFAVIKFDLKGYMDKMRKKHPNWSEANLRNIIRWQSTVNKKLREECKKFCKKTTLLVFDLTPEAMGVHVIRTAKRVGIPIKTKPKHTIYKIAVIGYGKEKKTLSEAFG